MAAAAVGKPVVGSVPALRSPVLPVEESAGPPDDPNPGPDPEFDPNPEPNPDPEPGNPPEFPPDKLVTVKFPELVVPEFPPPPFAGDDEPDPVPTVLKVPVPTLFKRLPKLVESADGDAAVVSSAKDGRTVTSTLSVVTHITSGDRGFVNLGPI
jgi:hypothetical protein